MPYPGDIGHPRTWMFMNSRILLLGLAFLADGEADETSSLELRSRPVEGALGTMPHNPWRPLGPEIVLAGNTFAVEVGADGESARIDTDGDGRCERELDGHRSTVHLRAGSDAGAFEYWVRIERHGWWRDHVIYRAVDEAGEPTRILRVIAAWSGRRGESEA